MRKPAVSVSFVLVGLVAIGALLVAGEVLAAEKLKFGTGIKLYPPFYLPVLAAEEKGFWKQNGLDVEWVPFTGGSAMYQAISAGALNLGFASTATHFTATAGGAPAVMIRALILRDNFIIVVRPESPIQQAKDLRGRNISVSRLWSSSHIYGLIVVKALGLEKEVRFVAAGGTMEKMAGLMTGSLDSTIDPLSVMAPFMEKGLVRQVASITEYLPKDWVEMVLGASRGFLKNNPDTVRKVNKALTDAVTFIKRNPGWAIEKMKTMQGYSEKVAKIIYDNELDFSEDGKISRKAIENARNIFLEYGIVSKERVLPVEELFSNEFVS